MTDYKSKTVCVVDNGLFVEFAVLLSRSFGKVLYWSPWAGGFPKSNALLIGEGLEGIKRVREYWSVLDEIDLFVFPDVYDGDLQLHLESLGKRVWGSRKVEQLELDRDGSKQLLAELGIKTGRYAVVHGLEALREHLKTHKDQFVKVSTTRGDMETFRSDNYDLIEPKLDELEHTLGAKKKIMEFIVEDAIEPAVEVGYDGFTIDGQFARGAMFGVEVKDKALMMKTARYDDIPSVLREINAKLAPVFKACRMRSFWSSEVRATPDGQGYLIDPCPRLGSPPGELFQIMVSNWPDIIWEGAEGNLVEPNFEGKWGAELLIISEWADKNWQAIQFPKSMRDNVKLRNCCMIDGRYYVVPQAVGVPEIGAVVAIGNSRKQAIDECNRIAEKVTGYYISVENGMLNQAADQLDQTMAMDEPENQRRSA